MTAEILYTFEYIGDNRWKKVVVTPNILSTGKDISYKLFLFGVYNQTYKHWMFLDLTHTVPFDEFNAKINLMINGTGTDLSKEEYHVLVEEQNAKDDETGEELQLRIYYIAKW